MSFEKWYKIPCNTKNYILFSVMLECSFHVGFKRISTDVGLTCGNTWGGNNWKLGHKVRAPYIMGLWPSIKETCYEYL